MLGIQRLSTCLAPCLALLRKRRRGPVALGERSQLRLVFPRRDIARVWVHF